MHVLCTDVFLFVYLFLNVGFLFIRYPVGT